jgi:molecular chaperone DnaK
MTNMLSVKSRISDFFDLDPVEGFDPLMAVAVGAALQGALQKGDITGLSFAEVTPAALSIETQSGSCVPVIAENTRVPVAESLLLSTSGPDQTEVTLRLLQGNSKYAADNIALGVVTLSGIQSAPRGKPDIEVNVSIDQDGVVHLSGKDCETNQEVSATISAENIGIQRDLLKQIKKKVSRKGEAESKSAGEIEKREEAEAGLNAEEAEELKTLREELRTAIFSTGFKLEMEGEHFRGPERDKLDRALEQGRKLTEGITSADEILKTIDQIKEGCEAFEDHLADFN